MNHLRLRTKAAPSRLQNHFFSLLSEPPSLRPSVLPSVPSAAEREGQARRDHDVPLRADFTALPPSLPLAPNTKLARNRQEGRKRASASGRDGEEEEARWIIQIPLREGGGRRSDKTYKWRQKCQNERGQFSRQRCLVLAARSNGTLAVAVKARGTVYGRENQVVGLLKINAETMTRNCPSYIHNTYGLGLYTIVSFGYVYTICRLGNPVRSGPPLARWRAREGAESVRDHPNIFFPPRR